MAVEFVHHETEQRAADALFNELRHYLGHGPGYHAGSEDDPNGHSAADKTATAPYVIMLAGGSTPIEVYRRVSEHPPRYVHPAVYLMLSDDRYVPQDDERSNFGTIAPLLDDLGLPEERFVHVDTSLPVDEGVARFSGDIHALGRRSAIFALGVLGIGVDGHTASLFSADAVPAPVRPGASAMNGGVTGAAVGSKGHIGSPKGRIGGRTGRITDQIEGAGADPDTSETFAGGGMLLTTPGEAAAVTTGVHGGVPRVSVTPDVLLSFRKLIFFAPGAAKRDILYELSRRPEDYPAGRIMLHHPNASIWTDEAPRVR